MRFTILHAGLSLALLSGCTGPVRNVQPGPEHPASPSAVEATLPPPSETLAVDTSTAPRGEAEGAVPPQVQQPGGDAATAGGHDHAATPGNSGTSAGPGGAAATSRMAATLYACPMHPEVTSTNPNDRCPKCGMKINKAVKVAATAPTAAPAARNAPAQHQHDHGRGNK
jgi:hypothetical protein